MSSPLSLPIAVSRAAQVEIATGTTSGSLSRTAYYSGGIGNSYSFDLGDVSARYVRLTLKGKTEYLQLCEIEVYGHGGKAIFYLLRSCGLILTRNN